MENCSPLCSCGRFLAGNRFLFGTAYLIRVMLSQTSRKNISSQEKNYRRHVYCHMKTSIHMCACTYMRVYACTYIRVYACVYLYKLRPLQKTMISFSNINISDSIPSFLPAIDRSFTEKRGSELWWLKAQLFLVTPAGCVIWGPRSMYHPEEGV